MLVTWRAGDSFASGLREIVCFPRKFVNFFARRSQSPRGGSRGIFRGRLAGRVRAEAEPAGWGGVWPRRGCGLEARRRRVGHRRRRWVVLLCGRRGGFGEGAFEGRGQGGCAPRHLARRFARGVARALWPKSWAQHAGQGIALCEHFERRRRASTRGGLARRACAVPCHEKERSSRAVRLLPAEAELLQQGVQHSSCSPSRVCLLVQGLAGARASHWRGAWARRALPYKRMRVQRPIRAMCLVQGHWGVLLRKHLCALVWVPGGEGGASNATAGIRRVPSGGSNCAMLVLLFRARRV